MKLSNDPTYQAWLLQTKKPRKGSILLTYNGVTKSVKQWSAITGHSVSAIHMRLWRGWTVEQTLTVGSISVTDTVMVNKQQ